MGGYLRTRLESGREADLYKGCQRNPGSSPQSLLSTWETERQGLICTAAPWGLVGRVERDIPDPCR